MVLPWPLLLLGSAGVSAGGALVLHQLFSRKRCSEEFFGRCDNECAYGEDPNTCVECLYTCGVPEEEHPFFFRTLFTPPVHAEEDEDGEGGYSSRNTEADWMGRESRQRGRGFGRGRRRRRRGRGRGRGGRFRIQDELDEMSRRDARRHVGGGHVNMTEDTRGYRGVILA